MIDDKTDENWVKNVINEDFANKIIPSNDFPEASVTVVHYLSEVQIEQGDGPGSLNMNLGQGNAIVSLSNKQAVEMARFILAYLGDDFPE